MIIGSSRFDILINSCEGRWAQAGWTGYNADKTSHPQPTPYSDEGLASQTGG